MKDNETSKNPFQDTVQKARNIKPRQKTDMDNTTPTQTDTKNKPSYIKVHVSIDADIMTSIKKIAAKNHWTQRTVFELALKNYMASLDD